MIKQVISGFAKDLGWTKEQVDGFLAAGTIPVEEVVKLILFFEFEKLEPKGKKTHDSWKGTHTRRKNNLATFKKLLDELSITISSKVTAKKVIDNILEKNPNAVTPYIKTVRSYLREIKKGR